MPERSTVRTVPLVAAIAAVAAVLVTASWELSFERIAANERARLLASLSSVLDPDDRWPYSAISVGELAIATSNRQKRR